MGEVWQPGSQLSDGDGIGTEVTQKRAVDSDANPPGRQIVEVDGWPVVEAAPGIRINDADVQRWRDDGQR